MIQFRASGAGNCTRQIVAQQLDPSLRVADEARRPFLDAGHFLQDAVEAFIVEQMPGELDVSQREAEEELVYPGWNMTGHIDGKFHSGKLLEVKAIKANSFEKLAKTYHFADQYGHYVPQATMYQMMFTSPGTHFVFYNRNTSEMMGSLDIDHPAWTKRRDMYVPFNQDLYDGLVDKFNRAAEYIKKEELPDGCDAQGYCWFCGTTGTTMKAPKKKSVGLLDDDDDFFYIEDLLGSYDSIKADILKCFEGYKASEIVLFREGGKKEVLRKEDYQ